MGLFFKKTFLVLTIIVLTLTGTGYGDNPIPKPENGVLNLQNWNFAESGMLALDGEWDFYWNKLLSYQDLKGIGQDRYAQVPETWDKYKKGHDFLPGVGYATYRLRVNTKLPEGALLALRLKTVSSAYTLFINDKPVAGAGRVGTAVTEEKGEYNPQTVVFAVPDKQFDIILQVSNFHYASGGLWDTLYLGDADQIHKYENRLVGREAFFVGVLIIIALLYLAIFFLLKELKYTLYFSLFSLLAAVYVDTVGEFLFINSSLPFQDVINIWYGAPGWMMLFLVMFMHELFPSVFSKMAARIYAGMMIVLQIFYFFANPLYYTRYAFISNLSGLLGVLITLAIIVMGARKGYPNWLLNLISIIALFIGSLYDLVYLTNRMESRVEVLFYCSALAALALQMITQAQRIKTYFDNKAAAELRLLQAQIKPHFLYNTINTIISVSRTDAEKARSLLIDFSQYLRSSFDFKASDQLVALSKEIELARAYIAIEKTRFGKRLNVNFHLKGDFENVRVPILVLQPIIENAIIHGVLPKPEGGSVDIDIHREGQKLSFCVKDSGVGISKDKLEGLLEPKGHHIGLSNIDARIRRLYKRGLQIKSKVDEGTEIKWHILIR